MNVSGFIVVKSGVMSLLQDRGRVGFYYLGLTNGGPLDSESFYWANRLCGNDDSATVIEITLGGLELGATVNTVIAVTGADIPFSINGQEKSLWRGHRINVGDKVVLGFARQGCRAYLAVAGGFIIKPQFGSTATVFREGVGGINGAALQAQDVLPCQPYSIDHLWRLAKTKRTVLTQSITLRVVLGYQYHSFNLQQQQRFFSSRYQLTNRCDRMGFCLEGAVINVDTCEDEVSTLLSEGISLGAIQIPADGQPIILLHDRQTIGGYPKIGTVISCDLPRLAQMGVGAVIHFERIGIEQAQQLLRQRVQQLNDTSLQRVG